MQVQEATTMQVQEATTMNATNRVSHKTKTKKTNYVPFSMEYLQIHTKMSTQRRCLEGVEQWDSQIIVHCIMVTSIHV